MLGKFWRWGKKPQTAGVHCRPFRAVVITSRVAEYRGTIAGLNTPAIEHWLFCQRITDKIGAALLAEGFRSPTSGKLPTHTIMCLFFLPRDAGQARCLFSVHLSLGSETASPDLQDWLANRITRALANSLNDCRDPSFLIRCRSRREFPLCLESIELDDFWLMESAKFYKFYARKVRALQPGERPK